VVSHTAAVVSLLNTQFPSPTIAGISPPPLPNDAGDPYVTVQEIQSKELESMTGASDLARSIVQVNIWDKDYEAADTLRTSIKNYLFGFTGNVVIASVTEAHVQIVRHMMDWELFNGEVERHQVIARFLIWWQKV